MSHHADALCTVSFCNFDCAIFTVHEPFHLLTFCFQHLLHIPANKHTYRQTYKHTDTNGQPNAHMDKHSSNILKDLK